jgi:atlastin
MRAARRGSPVKILSISQQEEKLEIHEGALVGVLDKIEKEAPGVDIAVLSVVGAFRMGKSFLLDLFLRYLRCPEEERSSRDWVHRERPLEGHCAVDCDDAGTDGGGFSWRGGSQRMTTGCWMWSEPFFLNVPGGAPGEKMALLILDTQGMFDGETSQKLTATIFGLTTMLSSLLVYNVSKQIQEDNLQHLQLFLEYGRLAHDSAAEATAISAGAAATSTAGATKVAAVSATESSKEADAGAAAAAAAAADRSAGASASASASASPPPFQHLAFLVRDWQNFDYDEEDAEEVRVATRIAAMETYFSEVMSTEGREHADLREPREQLKSVFDRVSCFLLPHPGLQIPRPKYNGE